MIDFISIREAVNYAVAALVVVIGWDIKGLHDLKEKHNDHVKEVAKDYVTRDDLRDFMDRTDDTLDRILEKLERKVDR